MSFLFPKTQSPQLDASDSRQDDSYQESTPLSWVRGQGQVAMTWISDRFNDQWSNGSSTGQAYCSCVGMICHGGSNPKAIKNAIRFAHEYALRGVNSRMAEKLHESFPGAGREREPQAIDAGKERAAS